jgi:hypothetical protein
MGRATLDGVVSFRGPPWSPTKEGSQAVTRPTDPSRPMKPASGVTAAAWRATNSWVTARSVPYGVTAITVLGDTYILSTKRKNDERFIGWVSCDESCLHCFQHTKMLKIGHETIAVPDHLFLVGTLINEHRSYLGLFFFGLSSFCRQLCFFF